MTAPHSSSVPSMPTTSALTELMAVQKAIVEPGWRSGALPDQADGYASLSTPRERVLFLLPKKAADVSKPPL